MKLPLRTVCKRVETDSEVLFLLVQWWSGTSFDIDVTDGVAAWRAVKCECPAGTTVGTETWIAKAQEALGLAEPHTSFAFESDVEGDARELRWYWHLPEGNARAVGRVDLQSVEFKTSLLSFLDAACELSTVTAVMTVENEKAQEGIRQDMETLKGEVEAVTQSRRSLYGRCAALINEKSREIEEKEREIRELRAKLPTEMEVEDPYSDVTA